jgi:dihydrolipoamide dehydrogenase
LFGDSPEAESEGGHSGWGHGKILGGGMVGEIALVIEMGADAVDIGKTIHQDRSLGESIGMAPEV